MHCKEQQPVRKHPLTLVIYARGHEEVPIHRFCNCSKRVAGLQSVVPVVDVCWVSKVEAALRIVLVEVHLGADILILDYLLLLVEPAKLGMRITTDCEFDAGIMALLGLSQSQDDRRN